MTHEEIIKEYRALIKVHQSNMQVVEMLDSPQVEIRIPFLEEWLDKTLTIYRTQVLEEVKQAHQNNKNETLWGDDDSNEVMKISIDNFIEAVEKELEHPTN